MRMWLLALGLMVTALSLDPSVAAQRDAFRWSGTVDRGDMIEIRGAHGSIRTISSKDDLVHVDARRNDPAIVRFEVVQHDEGVTVCAVYLGSTGTCRRGTRANNEANNSAGVDFVVRVPAGVRFAASMINGTIDVEGLRSDANVATITGNVNIRTTAFAAHATTVDGDVVLELPRNANADFYANTVSGTIDSDFPLASTVPPLPSIMSLPSGRFIRPNVPRPPQIVRATIGNGGPALRVTTVNGSIRLRRR